MIQCKKCKAWVKNLNDHIRRKRCEAVIERREARGMNINETLGSRGKRTQKRNQQKKGGDDDE